MLNLQFKGCNGFKGTGFVIAFAMVFPLFPRSTRSVVFFKYPCVRALANKCFPGRTFFLKKSCCHSHCRYISLTSLLRSTTRYSTSPSFTSVGTSAQRFQAGSSTMNLKRTPIVSVARLVFVASACWRRLDNMVSRVSMLQHCWFKIFFCSLINLFLSLHRHSNAGLKIGIGRCIRLA